VTHMPPTMAIDLFFSYISIPASILVALVLWGAWKLTEPDDKKRPKSQGISALGGSRSTRTDRRLNVSATSIKPPAIG
jgi:hypothetical protein